MAFPLTHLLVAEELLSRRPRSDSDAALFLLGSIAPDGVHYRKDFVGAEQHNIGPSKKITHLCPVSDERWGAVTDNEGWVRCVQDFAKAHTGPLAEGYAVHALTDIYNNMTLWKRFSTQHPDEAAKGYKSAYYSDLRDIDLRLYRTHAKVARIEALLAQAQASDMPGLVSAAEISAIRDNILYEYFEGHWPVDGYEYRFVSYDETLEFIQGTADFVENVLGRNTP